MIKTLRRFTFAPALALSIHALAGGALAADDTIKIGMDQPLTGAFAASGTYVTEGAKVAVAEINANGGVLGKQLELVIEDNKSNPTEAATVAEKLITSDKVPVIIGSWGSSLTLATMPKLLQYEVPMLVETSSSSKITREGNPWIFRISPPSWVEAEAFEQILPKFDIEKVAFLSINNDWGRGTIKDFTTMFEENGIEVVDTQIMNEGQQDLMALLTAIKGTEADTVIVTTAVEQLTLILKQAANLGFDKQIITTGGSQNPDQLIAQAGEAAEGSYHLAFFAPWEPEKTAHPELSKKFIAAWTDAGYNPPGMTEGYRGYDAVKVIAAAIEIAGKAEPTAIRDALWEVKVPVLNGTVEFIKDGPEDRPSGQYLASATMVLIKDGKVNLLGD